MKKSIFLIVLLVLVFAITSCQLQAPVEETEEPEVIEEQTETVEADAETDEEAEAGEANIVHLTDDNYHEIVDNSEGVVIVDFWATWCPPCVKLGPILEEVSAEEGITIYKVDVDENPEIAKEFRISSIPMVYFYKDGEIVGSQMGLGDKAFYVNKVNSYK